MSVPGPICEAPTRCGVDRVQRWAFKLNRIRAGALLNKTEHGPLTFMIKRSLQVKRHEKWKRQKMQKGVSEGSPTAFA